MIARIENLIKKTLTPGDEGDPILDTPRGEIAIWLDQFIKATEERWVHTSEDFSFRDGIPSNVQDLLSACAKLVGRTQQMDHLLRAANDDNGIIYPFLQSYGLGN